MSQSETTGESRDQETTGRTVVGMFTGRGEARAAISDLKAARFTEDQIGVAMQEDSPHGQPGQEPGGTTEGVATGALSGGVVGGLMGLLGSLLIPGLGPVVIGGVLASTLAGAGIGAATGGLIGALISLGVPEEDARHFDVGLRAGGVLVTVDAGARTADALEILERHGMDLGPTGGRRWRARANDAGQTWDRRTKGESAYAGPERRLVGV